MRMVRPLTCTSRSDFLTPGTSAITAKSSPFLNTLTGGRAPPPLGPASSSQWLVGGKTRGRFRAGKGVRGKAGGRGRGGISVVAGLLKKKKHKTNTSIL